MKPRLQWRKKLNVNKTSAYEYSFDKKHACTMHMHICNTVANYNVEWICCARKNNI